MIAGLRGLGLPAGYVSGYIRTIPPPGQKRLEGADASHAWVSVWCGLEFGWLDLDPTNAIMVGDDHIVVAVGRDYADVSPIDGVFTGPQSQSHGPRGCRADAVKVMPLSGHRYFDDHDESVGRAEFLALVAFPSAAELEILQHRHHGIGRRGLRRARLQSVLRVFAGTARRFFPRVAIDRCKLFVFMGIAARDARNRACLLNDPAGLDRADRRHRSHNVYSPKTGLYPHLTLEQIC